MEEEKKEEKKGSHMKTVIFCAVAVLAIIGIMIEIGLSQWNKKREKPNVPQPLNRVNQSSNNQTVQCLDNEMGIGNPIMDVAKKPIIYLYPTEETEISVKVDQPEKFTTTYPKYADGWEVVAKPDGTLTDCKTGRNLYALYWEGKRDKVEQKDCGFVVKRENTIAFLEEKLEILGLNEREAEEFIVYWLPQLEKNPYNWIYFEMQEEIEENMALEISPKPDTCIRVMMEWKGLNEEISVEEQVLEKRERSGYTVVEWGGTEVK